MSDSENRRVVEYERLNVLGKAIFITGAAVRGTARAIDLVLERAADIVVDAERAFKQELDANIEDAKVLEERRSEESPPA